MSSMLKCRNSSIDLLKLLFAITVVLFHFGGRQGVNMVTGGYLVVEGFFMITGYFMMNSASKARENDIARDTLRFISRKYSSIFLPLLFSVTAIYKNYALKELPFEIIYMLSEILPLQITGMHTLASTGVSWYLSAMLLALLILYPIARTAGKKFSKIICPILVFVIYGSLCLKFKQLNIITDLYYELPIRAGLLRGIAGICTGCMIYECVKATEKHKLTRLGEICFLVAEIVCVVFITVTICSHAKQVTDFFTLPFFFVLIYSFFGRKSLFSKDFSLISQSTSARQVC